MTTRVMHVEHYGYHTYKGYNTDLDKTEIFDCLIDATVSQLFNADIAMFQSVMGIYRMWFSGVYMSYNSVLVEV